MSNPKDWVITISGDRPIHDIAKDLAAAGLTKGQVLEDIGCITGSADESVAPALGKIPGVVDVTPDVPVDIGPPGAKIS